MRTVRVKTKKPYRELPPLLNSTLHGGQSSASCPDRF